MLLNTTFCPLFRFEGFVTDAVTPATADVVPCVDVLPFITKLTGKPLTVPPDGGGDGPVPFNIDFT